MSEDIAKSIQAAMAKKAQKQANEKGLRESKQKALEDSRATSAKWLESEVLPIMREFVEELKKQNIDSIAEFHNHSNERVGFVGPTAMFGIFTDQNDQSNDQLIKVTFSFKGIDQIQITYSSSFGGAISSREKPTNCKPTWKRDGIKRHIDRVVEAFFLDIWKSGKF